MSDKQIVDVGSATLMILMDLKKRLLKVRYLRHPYLITRAILRPLEVWDSKRHSLRLNEYERYSVSLEEAVEAFTGCPKPAITELVKELYGSGLLQYLHTRLQEAGDVGGSIGYESGTTLYVLVRIFKPEVVVETGVANGVSSSFILKALDQNSRESCTQLTCIIGRACLSLLERSWAG